MLFKVINKSAKVVIDYNTFCTYCAEKITNILENYHWLQFFLPIEMLPLHKDELHPLVSFVVK